MGVIIIFINPSVLVAFVANNEYNPPDSKKYQDCVDECKKKFKK